MTMALTEREVEGVEAGSRSINAICVGMPATDVSAAAGQLERVGACHRSTR